MGGKRSRREFLGLTGAGLAGAAVGGGQWACAPAGGASQGPADLVVFNAKVYTVDPAQPKAEAFAVKNNRFIAVGSNADIKGLAGKGTMWGDAKQRTVIPGCVDCHVHAIDAERLLHEVPVGNPYEVEIVTIDSIVQKLNARARETPAGEWVVGSFFDDVKVKDNRPLTVQDLDKASKDHPIMVRHRGGHTGFYNSKALQLAGITKNTPNPPGGTYDKDEHGELNGRVTDRARAVFDSVGKRPVYTPDQSLKRDSEVMAYISKQFVRFGLTSVCHQGGALAALQDIRAHGDLLHRVNFEVNRKILDDMVANGIRSGFGDEWIRFGDTSEHSIDGSFSERTMSMSQPFIGMDPKYRGNLTEAPEVTNAWAERMYQAGIVPNVHANGDIAIDRALTAFELAAKKFPRTDYRPKITHCTLINDDIIKRMVALGAVPAAFTSYLYFNSDKYHFYGTELTKRCMAFRTFLDAGIKACAGSDFGAGMFPPLMGIQGMVTRKGWNGETWGINQAITVDEALQVSTINGAYAQHEEHIKGSITPGKLADFVVLADDLHTVDPDKIKDIQVVRTVVGGKTVYQA